ncbi:hypothetical protein CY35_19G011100 [Sphagnum magellanicum]|nr:hypothetical protein CY35_19G011100 [Sphagnum magellanicum]
MLVLWGVHLQWKHIMPVNLLGVFFFFFWRWVWWLCQEVEKSLEVRIDGWSEMDNHKEASSDTTGSPKPCNRLPCFSGQSSPTEYTSSERSDDQAPGRCEEVLESMCNHGAEFGGASQSNHLAQKRCNSPARPNGASLSDAGGRPVVRLVREFCSQNSDQHSQDADTLDSATNDSLSNERASAESKPQRSPEITTAKISAQEKVVVMKCMSRLDRAQKAANVAEGKLPQKACAAAVSSDRIPMIARDSRPSQSPSLGCTNPARSAGLNSTSKRERYEEDKFGDMRLVVELDDSDDEDMANCSPRRLIAESDKTRSRHSCSPHHSNEDIEQQKLHLHKGGEEQLPAQKMTLVVDLSENGSTIAGSAVYQARVGASMVAGNLPVLKKRRTSRDRLQDGLPVVVAAVKESDTVLFKTGRTRLANKNYYSMSTKLRSSVRAKTVSARKIRKLVLPEDEEEARQTILVAKKEESDDEASTLSGDYSRKHAGEDEREVFHPDWSPGVLCDLCEKGPSLTLGGWYSWCCGAPTPDCRCPQEEQMMKKKLAKWKGGKKWTKKDPVYPWSGKVHRLCALWSSEVYESEGLRLEQLMSAVQRSRKIKCSDADCGLFGATLGCRVKKCKKNFHYPCADKLAVKLHVRMWDGMKLPVACKEHRHANQVCMDYKPKKKRKSLKKGEDSVASKQRQNGCESGHQKRTKEEGGSFYQLATDQQLSIGTSKPGNAPHEGPRIPAGAQVIDLYSSDDEQSPESGQAETNQKLYSGSPDTTVTTLMGQGVLSKAEKDSRWPNLATNPPSYLGNNLLCADFSRGREAVMVPCTNDVDDEPIPSLNYVTKSRRSECMDGFLMTKTLALWLEVTSMNWWSATVNVVVVQHVLTERCKGVSVYPLRCTKQLTKGGQCAHLFQYPGGVL